MSKSKGVTHLILPERIESRIFIIREKRVMLDADLAEFYGVTTKQLNQQVKRNLERFPAKFMFQLTREEADEWNRSQIVTGSQKHRDPRFLPYAFTEHGAFALSTVIKSKQAIQVGIYVVDAFVRVRQLLASYVDLANEVDQIKQRVGKHSDAIGRLVILVEKVLGILKAHAGDEPAPPLFVLNPHKDDSDE